MTARRGQGYRVMLVAAREVAPGDYEAFRRAYAEAAAALEGRQERMEAAYALLEHDMTCLGARTPVPRPHPQPPSPAKARPASMGGGRIRHGGERAGGTGPYPRPALSAQAPRPQREPTP